MKIKNIKNQALQMALQVLANEELKGVNIYETNNSFQARKNNEALKYGVNWCAKGTVSAEEAVEFANTLTKASAIATLLTSLEIESSDFEADDREYTREQFLDEVKKARYCLLMEEVDFVKMWLEKEVG